MIRQFSFAAMLAALAFWCATAFAGTPATSERIALVIGNDAYTRVPALKNARADAQAIARTLRDLGFDVTLHTDLDERGMRSAMRTFKSKLSGGSEAVFYFAGHGVQLGAANYLLPTNINADNEEQVKDDGLALQRVLDDMTEQRVRFSVAIIDACRDNPFPRVAGRSIGGTRGLAPTTAATGQMILFSAGSGQSALDRLGNQDRDPNGLFTRVLLKQMQQPGLPVDQVLKRTRQEVVQLAKSVGHEQVPALYDQSIGEFYFRPPALSTSVPAAQTAAPVVDPSANERAFWDSVKDTRNSEELRAYISQYPNGLFVALAKTRLNALQPSAAGIPAAGTARGTQEVEIRTNYGSIFVELYADKAPNTVANFLEYVKAGFYNGTIFHRVIDNFMIQGGGFESGMRQKATRAPIENEAANGLKNTAGTIVMARTSAPHSATAQFFINLKDNEFLNYREPTQQGYGYTVFGRVTRGFDVVQRIAKVATGNAGQFQNVPLDPVIMESVTLVSAR